MAISKLLLYYVFTPLPDPPAIRLWQRDLCERLGLKGRIVISPHGLNGTVAGEVAAVKQYVRRTREYPPFAAIDFKWSEATGEEFPRLSVKVRDEMVTFGASNEIAVDRDGVVGTGRHLAPEQVHELVEARGDEVAFFDARNRFEAAIGRFSGAVVPEVETTKDFVAELDSGRYDHLKDRPVVTYCTGGVRCEVLSAMMVKRGFSEVYQIDGGVVRYGETYGDAGLWEGSLYVFDDRIKIDFSDQAKIIGICETCGAATSDYRDCIAAQCKGRALLCAADASTPLCVQHR
ncbi:MAG: Rhodanese domain protein UPF0176, Actinobacterial subgroup [uncultured Propionibacteriaceae bacterium]|uniref:tRNA uridine(34) hydroxylase n=1 Tax=uncultured Propionibacteriaceae bacterium TaxID=257457 RepID=A0A6J4P7K9_9ACTN|nr:MAG: Rhodanese domain protein UPF0176, Actinobacterial subgroup [uncultured Propionibacteriaceae bacterium]